MVEYKKLHKTAILFVLSIFIFIFSMACPPQPHGGAPGPPQRPIISGPTNAVVGESYVYNLSGTDSQGSVLVFSTATPGCTITNGNVLIFKPTTIGTVTIRVVSENSYGLKSEPGEISVNVTQSPTA